MKSIDSDPLNLWGFFVLLCAGDDYFYPKLKLSFSKHRFVTTIIDNFNTEILVFVVVTKLCIATEDPIVMGV